METSVAYPYCLIRFGQDVGFKLAFMTKRIVVGEETGYPVGYVGHAANRHFSKICKDGNMTIYKTTRKFKNEEVIKDWCNLPSLKEVEQAIKKATQ